MISNFDICNITNYKYIIDEIGRDNNSYKINIKGLNKKKKERGGEPNNLEMSILYFIHGSLTIQAHLYSLKTKLAGSPGLYTDSRYGYEL